jgi:hypothetical protein
MLRCVALVSTGVSEELSVSFIRVTRIGELGKTLDVTSNPHKLRRNSQFPYHHFMTVPQVPDGGDDLQIGG